MRETMNDVTERRAKFVYDGARSAAEATNVSVIPAPWEERKEEFKAQFRGAIERQLYSPEDLQDSWMQSYIDMGWVYGEEYDYDKHIHPDLVPYSQLGELKHGKDAIFVALCDIAGRWIRL